MTKEINPLIIIGIIVAVALLYQYSSLGALYGTGYKVYANPTTIISETNEYVEYQIPFSIMHGNMAGSCNTGTNFDINLITFPSPSYFDGRSWGGSEMTLPTSSPQKNTNIELNREFNSEVSGISASVVWNPCADTTTSVNVIPYINSVCKVKDYTDDKQNIECSVNGYFNGISSSPLPGIPANTEITGGLKVTSFSGGNIKVKMYKIGFPIIQNKTYYRLENNLCSQISIQELEKTFNDYNTLEECQSKIQYFNQTQTNQTNQTSQNNSVCTESSKCIGFYYYECQNNSWIYKGNIVGKCGYTTSSSSSGGGITEKCYSYIAEICQEVTCNEARSQYKSLEFCQATNQLEQESFFDKYKWVILGLIIIGGLILVKRRK